MTVNIRPEMTIEELGEVLSNYLQEHWKTILHENHDELSKLFPEYEDATYGMYLDKLIPPAWAELERNGFTSSEQQRKDDFIIAGCLNFRNSLEKESWGTKNYEIRVFWIVVVNKDNEQIGTIIFELTHSHLKFEIPKPPHLHVIKSTDPREIRSIIIKLQE